MESTVSRAIDRRRGQVPWSARLLSVLLAPVMLHASAQSTVYTPAEAAIAEVVQETPEVMSGAVATYGLPSLAVGMVHDRETIFADAVGFANLEAQVPATEHTVYRVASLTKLITATMLVKLAEDGRVSLDDPVRKYLPEFAPASPFSGTQPITLRQLATHQSGLPRQTDVGFLSDLNVYLWLVAGEPLKRSEPTSKETFIESLSSLELEHQPYSPYGHYSNLGYQVLGVALERIAGRPYPDWVADNILEPLGMHSSFFDAASCPDSILAAGYVYASHASEPLAAPTSQPGISVFSGGMYSSVADMCRFLSLQFQDGPVGGSRIISGDNLRMMQWTGMDWAFRFDRQHPAVDHSGGVLGYNAHMIAVPDLKVGVVVMTNSMNTFDPRNPAGDIAWQLIDKLRRAASKTAEPPPFDADSVSLESYEGTYVLGDGIAAIVIEREEDNLYHYVKGHERHRARIVPSGRHTFRFEVDPDGRLGIEFEVGDGGVATALQVGPYRFVRSD